MPAKVSKLLDELKRKYSLPEEADEDLMAIEEAAYEDMGGAEEMDMEAEDMDMLLAEEEEEMPASEEAAMEEMPAEEEDMEEEEEEDDILRPAKKQKLRV